MATHYLMVEARNAHVSLFTDFSSVVAWTRIPAPGVNVALHSLVCLIFQVVFAARRWLRHWISEFSLCGEVAGRSLLWSHCCAAEGAAAKPTRFSFKNVRFWHWNLSSFHVILLIADAFGITILKPSPQSVWSQWLLGKQVPDVTPPNLKNRSWHDFPGTEVQIFS